MQNMHRQEEPEFTASGYVLW